MNVSTSPKPRNASIDIFRFVFAVWPIFNHTQAFFEIHPNLFYVTSEYLVRIVIPFFLGISGYFYSRALEAGRNPLKKQVKTLLRMYGVWTVIYYAASFVDNIVLGQQDLQTFLIERVVFFFVQGSYPNLWYFPAMIYSMLIYGAVHKFWGTKGVHVLSIAAVPLFLIGLLGSTYIEIGREIPLLADFFEWGGFFVFRNILCIGVPCYVAGYWVMRLEIALKDVPNRTILNILLAVTGLAVIEMLVLVFILGWHERPQQLLMCAILPSVLILCLLRYPMAHLHTQAWYSRRLSAFVMLSHPLVMVVITTAAGAVGIELPQTVMLVLVAGATLISGFILCKIDNPVAQLLIGFGMND